MTDHVRLAEESHNSSGSRDTIEKIFARMSVEEREAIKGAYSEMSPKERWEMQRMHPDYGGLYRLNLLDSGSKEDGECIESICTRMASGGAEGYKYATFLNPDFDFHRPNTTKILKEAGSRHKPTSTCFFSLLNEDAPHTPSWYPHMLGMDWDLYEKDEFGDILVDGDGKMQKKYEFRRKMGRLDEAASRPLVFAKYKPRNLMNERIALCRPWRDMEIDCTLGFFNWAKIANCCDGIKVKTLLGAYGGWDVPTLAVWDFGCLYDIKVFYPTSTPYKYHPVPECIANGLGWPASARTPCP